MNSTPQIGAARSSATHRHGPMRSAGCLLACVVLVLGGRVAGFALSDLDIGQLVILDDQPVMDAFVDRVDWLGDGQRFILGGWEQWPNKPMVLVVLPDGAVAAITEVANQHFALAPDGSRVLCWRKVGNGDAAQLVAATAGRGGATPVCPPVPASQAMQVFWAGSQDNDAWLMYALSEPGDKGGLYAIAPSGGAPKKILQMTAGYWLGLAPADNTEDVIAMWAGKQPTCYRLNPRAEMSVQVEPYWGRAHARAGTGAAAWTDERRDLLVAGGPTAVPTKLLDKADSLCWGRSGRNILSWRADCLWVVSADGRLKRKLLGMPTLLPLATTAFHSYGCSWSPDENTIVYWRNAGDTGILRRATLGCEQVKIRIEFPAGTNLPPGSPIWVADRFLYERSGAVIKPDWPRCKGLFHVLSRSDEGGRVVVTAENVGTEAGVVRRLTGSNDPPSGEAGAGHIAIGIGGAPRPVLRSFSAKPLPTIAAWPQGAKHLGRVLSVDVTRRNLGS